MSEINLMPGVNIAASGLAAQRARLEVIAQNIANASTTRGPDGKPYRRQMVALESGSDMQIRIPVADAPVPKTRLSTGHGTHVAGRGIGFDKGIQVGVSVTGVKTDASPLPKVYDPGHPDADADGYVEMPNVDLLSEMVDLMLASRIYEANLTVLEASRENSKQTLDLMR